MPDVLPRPPPLRAARAAAAPPTQGNATVPQATVVSIDELQRGRAQGARLKVRRVDDVLDYVASEGVAEPRILNVRTGKLRLAFLNCLDCRESDSGGRACPSRIGLLEGALGQLHKPVKVVEVACHRRGDALCEFEVTFG